MAMTAQRAVCVLFPHRANVLCTIGKSKAIVVSMVLFIAATHAHILHEYYVGIQDRKVKCVLIKEHKGFVVVVVVVVLFFLRYETGLMYLFFLCFPGYVLQSATVFWCGNRDFLSMKQNSIFYQARQTGSMIGKRKPRQYRSL